MKRWLSYLFLGLAVVAASSCQENNPEEEQLSDIRIQVGDISTKGLLNSGGLAVNGTQIKIYDYVSEFEGEIMHNGNVLSPGTDGTIKYINDVIGYNSDETPSWNYVSGYSYPWTRTGTHHFFGWTLKDGNNLNLTATNLFGTDQPAFDEETKILSIPSITMTASSTTQLDFCYSDVVQRASSYRDPVELPFHHLFTGLALAIENVSEDVITITSITTKGFANSKSASLDFSGSGTPVPTYTRTSAPSNLIPTNVWPKTMAKNQGFDLWTGNAYDKTAPNYIVMWPQDYDVDICGNGVNTPAGLVVEYTIAGVEENGNPVQFTSTINLKDSENITSSFLAAGHKYLLLLQFEGKNFVLKHVEVDPWDWVEDNYDYAASTISANSNGYHDGALWLYNFDANGNNQGEGTGGLGLAIDNGDGKQRPRVVPMSANDEFLGVFYIAAPAQGSWKVELSPYEAAQYFIISPSEGIIDANSENRGRTTFTVKAKTMPLSATQTATFKVYISINGEWRDANSEFNRKNWGLSRVYE